MDRINDLFDPIMFPDAYGTARKAANKEGLDRIPNIADKDIAAIWENTVFEDIEHSTQEVNSDTV